MKKILFALTICALALAASAQQQSISLSITVTNAATNGYALVINGGQRTFTNNARYPATEIQAATNGSLSASNLFMSLARSPFNGSAQWDGKSNVMMKSYPGFPLAVTTISNWATLTFTTNSLERATVVRVPKSVMGPIERTNVVNGLVDLIGDDSATNPIAPTAPAFANFLQLSVVIGYYQSGSNYTRIQTFLAQSNAVLRADAIGLDLTNLIQSFNLDSLGTAAFQNVDKFQPACDTLTNLCGINLNGLSYLDGSENIKLTQTNGTYPSVTRFEADSLGDLTLRFEDGVKFLVGDASHNTIIWDHDGTPRMEFDDASVNFGRTVIRSKIGNDSITISGQDDQVKTLTPITFFTTWPSVTIGTTTNFLSDANNSDTDATTVNNFTVPANTLATNGDSIIRTIGVNVSSGTSSKRTEVYFAGTQIFDTDAVANSGAGSVSIVCEVTRRNSSTVAYNCHGIGTATATTQWAKVGTIGGIDFTGGNNFYIILTTSGTGAASSQATVVTDNTKFAPSSMWQ